MSGFDYDKEYDSLTFGEWSRMIKYWPLNRVCSNIIDCPHETPEWKKEGFVVIRNFNLVDGQIDMSDGYFVDEETHRRRTKRAVPTEGDILFSREAPIGNCAIIPAGFQCCLGQRLVLLRVDKDVCTPEYLLTVLQSSFIKKQIEQVAKTGSIVSNFAIGDLKNLIIPILDNQNDIANLSSILSKKISNNKAICADLEAMAKLLYDYWFVQFDFPDENGKPYKSSGGKMVWNEELKREIPDGWEIDSIEFLISEREKSSVQVGEATGHYGNVPFFTSGDKIIMYDTAFTFGKNFFLNTGGNAGIKYYIGDAAYSTDTWCITAGNYSSYLYGYIDSIRKYLDISFFAGSGLKHLQKDSFKRHKIVIPPMPLIKKFNETADKCFVMISEAKIENQSLSELRDFLLPMLMTGQVKVKE